ncbi:MAG: 4-alpha-glucanotransferase [Phycisphaerales bacterium]|nr:4-alpha-glucanotransferase [Phycisphaerales bacterium]
MSSSHPLLERRLAGVLLHPTSLPARPGDAAFIGDLGPASRRFADWLRSAGFGLWQMLPICPVGAGNSPYSGQSSFAIEPMLVSLADLATDGLLPTTAVRIPASIKPTRLDRTRWAAARRFKNPRLELAYERFTRRRSGRAAFARFEKAHAHWLGDWCGWISQRSGGEPAYHAFVQFLLDTQWQRLRRHTRKKKVHLIGDLPIFTGADSADVAAHPHLFRLDRKGKPTVVTGVPPDAFSPDGQRWGHPHYDWPAHRKQAFGWWCDRVETSLDRFDLLRIDHFVGFVHAYEVSARAKTARRGRWARTPGRELLSAIEDRIGPLPFIAEDLGNVTPAVTRLRRGFNLPGMRILHWAFFNPRSRDLPHNHPTDSVVYPGTHDNDTTVGWWRSLPPEARHRFIAYTGATSRDIAPAMVRLAVNSPANLAIIQFQDLLGLGKSARMNRPGTALGNWTWRMEPGALRRQPARKLREEVEAASRLPK